MRPLLALAAMVAAGLLQTGRVQAAALEVSPVMVALPPGQTAVTIEVINRGSGPAEIQARAFGWTQAGDADVLVPTQDIILSPPIFNIPEGGAQTVRLLLRKTASAGDERSYRLLLDEVPQANAGGKQIVIALRLSLPVITGAASAGPPALQWRTERGPDGQTLLTAMNAGHGYDKVTQIAVTMPDGSHPRVRPLGKNPYILPGAQRHWAIEGRSVARDGMLRLSLTTQAGKSEQTLTP